MVPLILATITVIVFLIAVAVGAALRLGQSTLYTPYVTGGRPRPRRGRRPGTALTKVDDAPRDYVLEIMGSHTVSIDTFVASAKKRGLNRKRIQDVKKGDQLAFMYIWLGVKGKTPESKNIWKRARKIRTPIKLPIHTNVITNRIDFHLNLAKASPRSCAILHLPVHPWRYGPKRINGTHRRPAVPRREP